MLRSTFTPIFTTFPAKPIFPKLSLSTCNAIAQTPPPPVRQNASTKTTTSKTPHPPASAYLHLPFCRKRCHYCDFPILALGSSAQVDNDPRIVNYIDVLSREIVATQVEMSQCVPLKTVFFGGGTPSLVPPKLVSSVLEILSSKFGLCADAEISMEMDPGTFDSKKLKEFIDLGVNRVSLGVQAFQQELLKSCGRAHGIDEVHEAIEIVGSCGVGNWSMDLISSLPHQTPEMWEESLQLTIKAQPTHVSVYDLQVEQDTKFGVLYTPGEFPLPSDIQSAKFYRMASKMLLDAGYNHYEISSYSKSGFECKHNLTYWDNNKSFYGFGLGSASYIDGVRFSRPKKLKEYMSYVQDLEDGTTESCEDGGVDSTEALMDLELESEDDYVDSNEAAMDVVMLSLRTSKGLNLRSYREAFGGSLVISLCNVYKPYAASGHVVYMDQDRREIVADELEKVLLDEQRMEEELAYIRLSDPDGFLLSNELISLAFGAISS
ncbi:hypothetical protein DCAR_0624633 [Daucus carota subsp. sativus]|uniref:Radical S-adenosyl methionine domain-containing protein 1, mitochondrial n=1 Tax=Daucus carota subsp. sativus TaxID=79200 RepID=A0AAF0XDX7_DAUCS|nr:PREDICTED: oxygen-independent coproporphyrinogen-III oxidase-like protein sll1917 [Daucus carota subsp. sativus]WOH05219.1 hypothetical protein DCAR_0624633 [Daucus carota subsp. sativus]